MDLSQKPDTQDSLPKEEPGDEQRETEDAAKEHEDPTVELETEEKEQIVPDANDKAVDDYYVYMNYTLDIYAKIKNCNVIFFWSLNLAEKFTILLIALISSVTESPEKALEEKETPKYPKIRKILNYLNPCLLLKGLREMFRKLLELPSPITAEEMSSALNSLEKIYEDTLPPIESRIKDSSPAMSSLELDASADDLACGFDTESRATPPNGEISLRWRAYLLHKEVANRLFMYVCYYINSLPFLPTLLKKLSSPIGVLWKFIGAPVIAWLSNLINSLAETMSEFFEMPEQEDEPGPFYMVN